MCEIKGVLSSMEVGSGATDPIHGEDPPHSIALSESFRESNTNALVEQLCQRIDEAHSFFQQFRAVQPGSILCTPLLKSCWLSSDRSSTYIKLETEQVTSSFKARGVFFFTHKAVKRGIKHIITASSGNHGMGLVNALNHFDCTGTIFLPRNAAINKIKALERAIKAETVDLEFVGDDCGDTERAAALSCLDDNENPPRVYVSPYNDIDIMAGHGTIATEILDHLTTIDRPNPLCSPKKCCYVTVGGGGLISAIAAKLKSEQPRQWRIVGCLPKNSAVMYKSVKAGRVVHEESLPTLSDGSAGGLEDSTRTLALCATLVDAWVLVTEEEIEFAMAQMFHLERKVLEGSAGVAVSGFLRDAAWREEHSCHTAVVIACGANVHAETFVNVLSGRGSTS